LVFFKHIRRKTVRQWNNFDASKLCDQAVSAVLFHRGCGELSVKDPSMVLNC